MRFTCLNIEYMHFCCHQWKWATNFIFQKNWLWNLKKKLQSIVCKCFCLFSKNFISQQRIVFSKQSPPFSWAMFQFWWFFGISDNFYIWKGLSVWKEGSYVFQQLYQNQGPSLWPVLSNSFFQKREQWAIPEKIQTGRVEDILFWTPLEFFIFLLYPLKFQTNQNSTPGYSINLC